jgi:hypothetical protein
MGEKATKQNKSLQNETCRLKGGKLARRTNGLYYNMKQHKAQGNLSEAAHDG